MTRSSTSERMRKAGFPMRARPCCLGGSVRYALAAQPRHPALVASIKGVPGAAVPVVVLRAMKFPMIPARAPDPSILAKVDRREDGLDRLVPLTQKGTAESDI